MDPEDEIMLEDEDDVCPHCLAAVWDCICEYIDIQYLPMQTDDAAVDHSVWTKLGRVLA